MTADHALDPDSPDQHKALRTLVQFMVSDLIASLDAPRDYFRSLQSRARMVANEGNDPYESRTLALDWVDELCEDFTAMALKRPDGWRAAPLDSFRDTTPRPVDLRQFIKP